MDYEDIYNRFEAGGQNVNVRNGRARARVARAHNPFKDSWWRYAVNPSCIPEMFIDLESICSCLKNGVLSAGFH